VTHAELHGVLVVDKPEGPTSHDVVQRIRKIFRTREVGHAGTLDPMATGVLVVAIGEATKLVPYLTASDKTYRAAIRLGVETDTLDAQGREIARTDVDPGSLDRERIERALAEERARRAQVPPAYSAIKQAGEAAHTRARRGEAPRLEPRDVSAKSIALLGTTAAPPTVSVELTVSKGYYVRSFARDLARALGTVGHLVQLRRTASGPFTIDEACVLESSPEQLGDRVIALAAAATRVLGGFSLSDAQARDARQGKRLDAETMREHGDGLRAWLGPDGSLVAVGELAGDGRGRVLRGFGGRGQAIS
jgi:tRNA pseudouridine55 synthase